MRLKSYTNKWPGDRFEICPLPLRFFRRRYNVTMNAEAWDNEVDAVVAGSGGAGLAAAIELADAKADVIVFEKQASIEDSSTYQCGFCRNRLSGETRGTRFP
jgi:hypothetical protein